MNYNALYGERMLIRESRLLNSRIKKINQVY